MTSPLRRAALLFPAALLTGALVSARAAVKIERPENPAKKDRRHHLAATFVRSKDLKIHRGAHEVEELIGDVYYRQSDRQIRADWAQHDVTAGQWDVRGHVHADLRRKNGDVVEVEGRRAHHDEATGRGWVTGDPQGLVSFRYFAIPEKNPEGRGPVVAPAAIVEKGSIRNQGTARSMEWDEKSSDIRLKGDVHSFGEDGESWSEEAVYHRDSQTIDLVGRRPVVRRDDPKLLGAVQADRIMAADPGRRIDANGKVKGWIRFKQHQAEQSKFSAQ